MKYLKIATFFIVISLSKLIIAGDDDVNVPVENHVSSNMAVYVETVIDASAKEVWPYLLDRNSWITDFIYKNESGSLNEEGEIKRLYNAKNPLGESSFLVKTIKIIPERLMVTVNPLREIEGGTYGGFNVFMLEEHNGKTKVIFIGSKEIRSAQEHDFSEFTKAGRKRWTEKYLPRLKEIVEAAKG